MFFLKAVRRSLQLCLEKIAELSVKISKSNAEEFRSLLEKCAATALNSKLIHQQKDFFSKMVVDAVLSLDSLLPLNMIGKTIKLYSAPFINLGSQIL